MWPKGFDLGDTLFRYYPAGNLFDKILKQNKNSWDCIVSTNNIETAFALQDQCQLTCKYTNWLIEVFR